MALIQNVVLRFNQDLFSLERDDDSRGVGSRVTRRNLQLKSSTKTNIDTINGKKKVNGMCGDEIPFSEQRNMNLMNHEFLFGRFVEERFVFRQAFVIRSYEIGPDKTATMETLMNLLQETALNHVANSGVAGSGFGATREMSLRKLIWVVTRIHVQIDKYSSWGDVVEIDTWVNAAGKNGMRRDWIIRDYKSQKIITRATSTWAIMNRETRRLSKIPDEVRNELLPFYLNREAIAPENIDRENIDKLSDETASRIRTGLAPRWSDMDANQHVNNVKYIGWILESMPTNVLEDYKMKNITLEYRRECRQSNVLESLTSMKPIILNDEVEDQDQNLECTSLLRMEGSRAEIVRARSLWHFKQHHHTL
ncbi:fatty acyl-ACP thioesterases B [Perilla frutescens var. frutescens]|nr:fatty acyl-ACP thioesterases B [Perilla frutescens var. frutescens]